MNLSIITQTAFLILYDAKTNHGLLNFERLRDQLTAVFGEGWAQGKVEAETGETVDPEVK